MQCKDQRFAVAWCIVSGLDYAWYSISAIRKWRFCTEKKSLQGCKKWRVIFRFFWLNRYESVVMASSSESGDMGLNPQGFWNPMLPSAILRSNEPVSAPTRALSNCCTLYNSRFSQNWSVASTVAISRWQGFYSQHEDLTFALLSTWSLARGPDLVTFAGLARGQRLQLSSFV